MTKEDTAKRPGRAASVTGLSVRGPARDAETDGELHQKLVLVAAARVVVVTLALLFLAASTRYRSDEELKAMPTWQFVLIGSVYAISIVHGIVLRYPRLWLPLAYFQTGLDALIVSILVLMTGGVHSVFSFAYVFPVLASAITLYRGGALSATVASTLMLGAILTAQFHGELGGLAPSEVTPAIFSFVMWTLSLAVIAVLASALTEKLRATGLRLQERESDLAALEQLHAQILRSLPAGLITVDDQLLVRYANEAAEGILGRARDDILSRDLGELLPEMAERCRSQGPLPGRRDRPEVRYVRPDGAEIRIGFSFGPLRLESGEDLGHVVVFQDLTEIARLKAAVSRAEQLATIGKFAAGLAHEVRNPLASMCASVSVLESKLSPPPALARLMRNVVREGERLDGLVTDFLALAKPRAARRERCDLGQMVREVAALFAADPRWSHIEVDLSQCHAEEAAVDEDLFRQVIWNLVKNAGEAMMDTGGILRVRTGGDAELLTLTIEDTGPGMDEQQLARIFDPFYTTKDAGSGLGLAVTHSVIEAHDAEIDVDSAEGCGTTVSIRVPRELSAVMPVPEARQELG